MVQKRCNYDKNQPFSQCFLSRADGAHLGRGIRVPVDGQRPHGRVLVHVCALSARRSGAGADCASQGALSALFGGQRRNPCQAGSRQADRYRRHSLRLGAGRRHCLAAARHENHHRRQGRLYHGALYHSHADFRLISRQKMSFYRVDRRGCCGVWHVFALHHRQLLALCGRFVGAALRNCVHLSHYDNRLFFTAHQRCAALLPAILCRFRGDRHSGADF